MSDEDTKDIKATNRRQDQDKDNTDSSEQLLPDLTVLDSDSTVKTDSDNLTLLTELGLVDTKEDFGEFQNGLGEFKNKQETEDVFDKLLNDLSIGQ